MPAWIHRKPLMHESWSNDALANKATAFRHRDIATKLGQAIRFSMIHMNIEVNTKKKEKLEKRIIYINNKILFILISKK
jgi:hypothetical protein